MAEMLKADEACCPQITDPRWFINTKPHCCILTPPVQPQISCLTASFFSNFNLQNHPHRSARTEVLVGPLLLISAQARKLSN
jgi:hypothetical protein